MIGTGLKWFLDSLWNGFGYLAYCKFTNLILAACLLTGYSQIQFQYKHAYYRWPQFDLHTQRQWQLHRKSHPSKPVIEGPIMPTDLPFDPLDRAFYGKKTLSASQFFSLPDIQAINKALYHAAPSTIDHPFRERASTGQLTQWRDFDFNEAWNPRRLSRLRNCASLLCQQLALSAPDEVLRVVPARVHLDERTQWLKRSTEDSIRKELRSVGPLEVTHNPPQNVAIIITKTDMKFVPFALDITGSLPMLGCRPLHMEQPKFKRGCRVQGTLAKGWHTFDPFEQRKDPDDPSTLINYIQDLCDFIQPLINKAEAANTPILEVRDVDFCFQWWVNAERHRETKKESLTTTVTVGPQGSSSQPGPMVRLVIEPEHHYGSRF